MMTTFSSMNERSHANTEAEINCMPAMEGARDGPFVMVDVGLLDGVFPFLLYTFNRSLYQ